ncbi:MAG: pimeloyl-CoA dehydrogenase small subunit [Alphaproteobacteria bacterium]|nr:pimeloyl-CoA dehydrogenase small subunit [Alphaproteobacteria bacterium]
MEFKLTETQSLLQETALRLMREKYSFEQRKQILGSAKGWSQALWKEYAELGLLGVEIDEEFGGSSGSFGDLAVVLEAFGRGLAVEPFLSTVVIGAGLISSAGSADQKKAYLSKISEGKMTVAFALGEPGSRFAPHRISTSAKAANGGFVLNGAKAVVIGGNDADMLIAAARIAGAETAREGLSLFLIDAKTKGVDIRAYRNTDERGAAEITFEQVHAPAGALLGPPGGAADLIDAALDRANAALVCETTGAIDAVNDLTLDYIKTRVQFGRPIGKFQALQHRMADMAMTAQLARSMMALAIDYANSTDAAARAWAISAAKVQIIQSAQIAGRGAIQLHGGIGMTLEYAAGHYLRRMTAMEKMFGDYDWHLTRFSRA